MVPGTSPGTSPDNNLSGRNIGGFEVSSFDMCKDGARIFIAVANKNDNEAILEQIRRAHRLTLAVRYQDLNEHDITDIIKSV